MKQTPMATPLAHEDIRNLPGWYESIVRSVTEYNSVIADMQLDGDTIELAPIVAKHQVARKRALAMKAHPHYFTREVLETQMKLLDKAGQAGRAEALLRISLDAAAMCLKDPMAPAKAEIGPIEAEPIEAKWTTIARYAIKVSREVYDAVVSITPTRLSRLMWVGPSDHPDANGGWIVRPGKANHYQQSNAKGIMHTYLDAPDTVELYVPQPEGYMAHLELFPAPLDTTEVYIIRHDERAPNLVGSVALVY